jgi:transcriptional regulator with XRE-family HTH domain
MRGLTRQLSLWEASLPQEPSGDLVAAARNRQGWSQAELASVLGVHQTSVSRLESGARNASYDELLIIAAALGMPVERLLGDAASEVRRHRRAGHGVPADDSRALAARMVDPAVLREFVARGGSQYAVGQARSGRQPFSARQAAIALSVLADLEPR